MNAIQKIIDYHYSDEINSFEEVYDVEFPETATLAEQIKFVADTEEEHYPKENLEEKRHILYYLLVAQVEEADLLAHLREVGEHLYGCREDEDEADDLEEDNDEFIKKLTPTKK